MRRVVIGCCALLMCVGCDGELKSYDDDPAAPQPDLTTLEDMQSEGGVNLDMMRDATSDSMDMVSDTRDMNASVDDMDSTSDADMAEPDMGPAEIQPRYMDPDYNPNKDFEDAQDMLFSCSGESGPWAYTLARMQRIDRLEWVRNTGNWYLTRDTSTRANLAGTNPFELSVAHGFSTFRQDASVNNGELSQYMNMISEAARGWRGLNSWQRLHVARDSKLNCFYDESNVPDAACIETWVRHYLEYGAFFQPPTDEQVTDWVDFMQDKVLPSEATGQTRQQSIEVLVSTIWMSTPALFRSELAESTAQPDDLGRIKLSDWQIAQQLAAVLGRRAAGSPGVFVNYGSGITLVDGEPMEAGHMVAIRDAARDGSISDPEVIANLIRTYATGIDPDRPDLTVDVSPSSREFRGEFWVSAGIQRFFREWLGVDQLSTKFKDSAWATSKYDDLSQFNDDRITHRKINDGYAHLQGEGVYSREPLYIQQLDDMIARVVQSDDAVLENLLTSRTFFTPNGALSSSTNSRGQVPQYVYNIEDEHDGSRANRWRTLPAHERTGILTHPAWLAAHSDNFENGTGIIYRGKWVRESLLCGDINPVEGSIDAKLVSGDGLTARERLRQSTGLLELQEKPQCMACHVEMNPYGLPFEIYNHAGFVRAHDQNSPPDGSSQLPTGSVGGLFVPPELRGLTINSAVDFSTALSQSPHVKRCFIRQTFRYFMARNETPADSCTLKAMEDAYDMNNGSFVEMLVALMTSDAFLYRLQVPPEP